MHKTTSTAACGNGAAHILDEERKQREKARKKRELREWLISEARIEEQFVDGKHMPLYDALGIHCKDELARLAKLPRFDEEDDHPDADPSAALKRHKK